MRNSFEDMKNFIAKQDDMIMDTGDKQHNRTVQKIINGPRPQPLGTPRVPRRPSTEDEVVDELPKRKNVFKRALKGLGGRNSNDLARIEEMLIQLLGEVEDLKAGQGPHAVPVYDLAVKTPPITFRGRLELTATSPKAKPAHHPQATTRRISQVLPHVKAMA